MSYGEQEISFRSLAAAVLGIALFCTAMPRASYAAEWNVGISGGDHGIDGFHLSVGEYYDVPEREVVVIRDRGIDDDELPVVFFLARRAHVYPNAIVDLRMRGMSWMDITLHFGLYPDIYYVPVPVYVYEKYPHAWGHYKKYPKKNDWRKIRLRDADVVNQVNLIFMRDHYRYNPGRVIKYRSEGKRFAVIDRELWKERNGRDRDRYYVDRDWRRANQRNWDKGPKRVDKRIPDKKVRDHGKNDKGGGKNWQNKDHGGKGRG
jgi:hypothetical protein